ncbi:hypothetical protein GCM10008910_08340 [Faecalicatena orotica]|uniref:Thioredoxin reductase n=1 Tax=Faecalicatena orotica TaxID=1544 RepID=A0A2Y9BKX3_9FIRM|nr:NAD(P)/FAD-dependent oxidoreductase [Faecalicatena orotica]PWJ23617.1 thioredoxin reductase [Faecalicatena orotica]SSA57529.1 Thioredoxin reductase [Faecalicatena orotica]
MKREVVIIGAGPAGLAAAIEATKNGCQVLLVDENRTAGGQFFKQLHKFFGSQAHSAGIRGFEIGKQLLKETEELGVEVWLESSVIGIFAGKRVAVLRNGITETVEAQSILICTGGAENPLRFPGWTYPGVMGAGAAQTMVNVNRVLPGKRILMIGSGNVGVIVAYQLLQAGADVVGIVEGMPRIGAYGVHAAKLKRAGVPFFIGHTIAEARGSDRVEEAVIARFENGQILKGTERKIDVDTICVAVGLRPLSELAQMAGVKHGFIPELGGFMPIHNTDMETSVEGIYVAGDTAGVEEASTAMDEGRLAAVSVSCALGHLNRADAEQKKEEIRDRLASLRQGPFGERRMNAKNRVIEMGVTM